jgi:hypothetical protein
MGNQPLADNVEGKAPMAKLVVRLQAALQERSGKGPALVIDRRGGSQQPSQDSST